MCKLVFNVANVILNLEVQKIKPTKSKLIMTYVKLSKTCFWDTKIEKQTKITTHMNL
jgi:hypothetical protein